MSASRALSDRVSRRELLRWSMELGVVAGASGSLMRLLWPTSSTAQAHPAVTTTRSAAELMLQRAQTDLPDWVKLPTRSLDNWRLTDQVAGGSRFTLTPNNLDSMSGVRKHVLVLFTKPLNTFDATLAKILDVLAEKQMPVSLTLLNYEQDPAALRAALAFAEVRSFDLVAPMGSEVTEDVYHTYSNGKLPVLSLFTKDPVLQGWVSGYDQSSGSNLAYCSVAVPLEVQLAYVRQLKGNIKNIAVLYSTTSRSTIEAQVEPLRTLAHAQGLSVIDVAVQNDLNPEPEFAAQIPAAIEHMIATDPGLQQSVFWATGTTAVINSIGVISKLVGQIAVVSVYPDLVQEGNASAVFSVGIAYENVGYLDTVYLLDILYNGRQAGDLKVGVITPPDLAISFRKAREIGLKIPFGFFENAGYVYDHHGRAVRRNGQTVTS